MNQTSSSAARVSVSVKTGYVTDRRTAWTEKMNVNASVPQTVPALRLSLSVRAALSVCPGICTVMAKLTARMLVMKNSAVSILLLG